MFDYFKDGANPRGAEYGATARAASAAQRQADAAEDLLALQLASSPAEHAAIAAQISNRRFLESRRRAWWHRLDLIVTALLVGGIAWDMLTPHSEAPQSAVTISAPASASTDDVTALAPDIPVRAPDAQGSDDPEAIIARGDRVLHDAGLNDQQIYGARKP